MLSSRDFPKFQKQTDKMYREIDFHEIELSHLTIIPKIIILQFRKLLQVSIIP